MKIGKLSSVSWIKECTAIRRRRPIVLVDNIGPDRLSHFIIATHIVSTVQETDKELYGIRWKATHCTYMMYSCDRSIKDDALSAKLLSFCKFIQLVLSVASDGQISPSLSAWVKLFSWIMIYRPQIYIYIDIVNDTINTCSLAYWWIITPLRRTDCSTSSAQFKCTLVVSRQISNNATVLMLLHFNWLIVVCV